MVKPEGENYDCWCWDYYHVLYVILYWINFCLLLAFSRQWGLTELTELFPSKSKSAERQGNLHFIFVFLQSLVLLMCYSVNNYCTLKFKWFWDQTNIPQLKVYYAFCLFLGLCLFLTKKGYSALLLWFVFFEGGGFARQIPWMSGNAHGKSGNLKFWFGSGWSSALEIIRATVPLKSNHGAFPARHESCRARIIEAKMFSINYA